MTATYPSSGSGVGTETDPIAEPDITAHKALTTTAHGGIVASTDSRLTDTRTPTDGTVIDAKVAANAAIAESKLALASDAAAGTASRRTLGSGAAQAAQGSLAEYVANKGAASGYMGLDASSRGVQNPKLHASAHARGGADVLTALDGYYQSKIPKLVVPAMGNNLVVSSTQTIGVNFVVLVRAVIPESGQLHDLSVWLGTSSGNVIGCVYDTGDALAGSRTRLYASASTPCGSGSNWQSLGDPNLAVTAGQQIEMGFVVDNATASFGRQVQLANTALPANFAVASGGAASKLTAAAGLGSFAAPATIAEASLSAQVSVWAIIARIV